MRQVVGRGGRQLTMQTKRRQIIALGGSGFLTEPETLALEGYVLSQARTAEPAVCFIPTANGDSDTSLVRFYTVFTQLQCRPSHLLFFRRTPVDLRSYLLRQDVIYVGGGNTRSFVAPNLIASLPRARRLPHIV